jgi:flagellar biosynthesis protein FlhG
MNPERKESRRAAVIAITSGKGGVGKTNVGINVAAALARRGYRVAILDADFGLGNIDVMLGLTPTYHLGHVLTGEKELDDVVIDGPLGIQIIPAGTGIRALTALSPEQWRRLSSVIEQVTAGLDFLFIDTAAGISDNVVELLLKAERVAVVTSFDPAAVVDAYAVIKILTSADRQKEIGVVVSAARNAEEANLVFRQLDTAASRFLQRGLRYYGFIVSDPAVRDAVLMQRPLVDHLPQAPASRCFRILASRMIGNTSGSGPGLRIAHRDDPPDDGDTTDEDPQCA